MIDPLDTPVVNVNQLIAERHAKLKVLQEQAKASGKSAFPNTFRREHYAGDLQTQYAEMSKEQLAAQVFGLDEEASPDAIEIYVHRLRKKLDGHAVAIVTFRGLGYLLEHRDA